MPAISHGAAKPKKPAVTKYAYKVTASSIAEKDYQVGDLFLSREYFGKRWICQGFNSEKIEFFEKFTARYLGVVTARTNSGKVRQLLALPGTSLARMVAVRVRKERSDAARAVRERGTKAKA